MTAVEPPSEEVFASALHHVAVVRSPDGAVSLIARPAGGEVAEVVGEFLAQLLEANPAAGPWLNQQLDRAARRNAAGECLVPAAEIIDGLTALAQHGRGAGWWRR